MPLLVFGRVCSQTYRAFWKAPGAGIGGAFLGPPGGPGGPPPPPPHGGPPPCSGIDLNEDALQTSFEACWRWMGFAWQAGAGVLLYALIWPGGDILMQSSHGVMMINPGRPWPSGQAWLYGNAWQWRCATLGTTFTQLLGMRWAA